MESIRFGIDFGARTAELGDGLGVDWDMRNEQEFWWDILGK